jgi:hypothetical protein
MRPEPLIQKLFAIERAIGSVQPAQLRAMVVDAEEAALRLDLDNLHCIDELHRRLAECRCPEYGERSSAIAAPGLQRTA